MSRSVFLPPPPITHVFVGSTNPVKVMAVKRVIQSNWSEIVVSGLEVNSGVSAQPKSDLETQAGADERARQALTIGLKQTQLKSGEVVALGVGLEGGVFQPDDHPDELWSTVWVSVANNLTGEVESSIIRANGARFKLPDQIAHPILQGQEMGKVVGSLTHNPNLKREGGMIGLITANFVDRTIEYTALFKLALGLWYGRDWYRALSKS